MNTNVMLGILCLGTFAVLSAELGFMGILPLIAQKFSVNEFEAGLCVSVFAIIIAICAPIVPLFARFNHKNLLLISLSVFSLCAFLWIFIENFYLFLVLRAIPAFFQPLYVAIALSVAAHIVSKEEAPKAVAKIFAAVSAGLILGIPLASFMASEFSLAFAMGFFFVLNFLALIATFFLPKLPADEGFSYKSQLQILKLPIIWISIVCVVFINGGVFGFYSYLSEFLLNASQMPFTFISLLLCAFGIFMLFGNILAGKLLVYKPIITLNAVPLCMLVLYILLFFIHAQSILTSLIVCILGILAGIANNANHFCITQYAKKAQEFANGLFICVANVGLTLGTSLCGFFITHFKSEFAPLAAALLFAMGLAILSIRLKYAKKYK